MIKFTRFPCPEHEPETGLWRGGLVDGDDGGDHLWPEGQRQRTECGQKDQCDHIKWPIVVVLQDAQREHDCCDRPNRREYEQIRPIDPAMQDWKIFDQRVSKDNHEKRQHADREHGDLAARDVTNLRLALSDQPAGTKEARSQGIG
jgi:hypothetical protein